jgi:hypothetical protein
MPLLQLNIINDLINQLQRTAPISLSWHLLSQSRHFRYLTDPEGRYSNPNTSCTYVHIVFRKASIIINNPIYVYVFQILKVS